MFKLKPSRLATFRALFANWMLAITLSWSAAALAAPETVQLSGPQENGAVFRLADWRGQVVMVYVWNTGCPVCLDMMPELRANTAGWSKQPFRLVSINTDAKEASLRQWLSIRRQLERDSARWPVLWAGAPGFSSSLELSGNQPAIWVLDKQGVVRFQARGRLPAEVWDAVAELL